MRNQLELLWANRNTSVPQPTRPDSLNVIRHPTKGTYLSYRITHERSLHGASDLKIVGTYRNRQHSGERRVAGGFKNVEEVERYIARFLPEFLNCM